MWVEKGLEVTTSTMEAGEGHHIIGIDGLDDFDMELGRESKERAEQL